MHAPASAGSRLTAAFAAVAIALAIAALLLVVAARDFIAADRQIDAVLRGNRVLSNLSSTGDAAGRGDARAMATNSVPSIVDALHARRAQAAQRLRLVEAWSALAGALTVAVVAVAACALRARATQCDRLLAGVGTEPNHDPLTGLPNRRFFTEWLSFAIAHARRERTHVGVLFIDINGCAAVAELHGGPAAEALLVEVARRFRAAAREGDVFARLGAGEFALATPNACDTREMSLLAQRLRDALNDPAQPPLADTPVGTSIGVAFFPEDADDSAGVMAAANAAMFAARRAGRDHVAFNAIAA